MIDQQMFLFMKRRLYGPLSWMGFNWWASRLEWEPVWGGSLLFTITFLPEKLLVLIFINLSENNTNTDADQKPYFQNLNLRTKADLNFRGTFLKNSFRHLKWYSNPPSWLARRRCHMGIFRKTEDLSSHFWESQPFRFRCVEGHRERRLKSTKTGISS